MLVLATRLIRIVFLMLGRAKAATIAPMAIVTSSSISVKPSSSRRRSCEHLVSSFRMPKWPIFSVGQGGFYAFRMNGGSARMSGGFLDSVEFCLSLGSGSLWPLLAALEAGG